MGIAQLRGGWSGGRDGACRGHSILPPRGRATRRSRRRGGGRWPAGIGGVTLCGRGAPTLAWILGGLPALAVAGDAMNPAGAAWVALDLPLAFWAGLALGTWRGARFGAKDTSATGVSMGSFALAGVHIPLTYVALAPPEAVTGLLAYELLGLGALLAVVSAATGGLAWTLTAQSFDRFDEWVGRPRRAAGTPGRGGSPPPP